MKTPTAAFQTGMNKAGNNPRTLICFTFNNLLSNGGFEFGLAGWTSFNALTAILDIATFHNGKASVKLSAPTSGDNYLASAKNVPVNPSTEYIYSGWVYVPQAISGGATYLRAIEWDASGNVVKDIPSPPTPPISVNSGWQHVIYAWTTQPTTTQLQLRLDIYGVGTAWWDDLTLFEGGSPGQIFVSDGPWNTGAQAYEPLVLAWQPIYKQVNPDPLQFDTADWKLTLANTGTPFSSYFAGIDPLTVQVDVYHWFAGTTDSDKLYYDSFVVSDIASYDEEKIELDLVSLIEKYDANSDGVCNKISPTNWPYADPEAYNRGENIIYGNVKNVPCPAVVAGALSTLVAAVDAKQLYAWILTCAPNEIPFLPSGTLQVGDEQITYTSISASGVLSGVMRAQNGTQALSHQMGDVVFQVIPSYEYLVAGHPVKSIGNVYVDGVRVVNGQNGAVTINTNNNGKATLAFSSKFYITKSIDQSVSQGSHSHKNSQWTGQGYASSSTRWTSSINPRWYSNQWAGYAFLDSNNNWFLILDNGSNYLDVFSISHTALATGSYTGGIYPVQTKMVWQDAVVDNFDAPAAGVATALCDKTNNAGCGIIATDGYVDTTNSFPVSDDGYIVGARLCSNIGQATYNGTGRSTILGGIFNGLYAQGGGSSMATAWRDLQCNGAVNWAAFNNMSIRFTFSSGSAAAYCYEHWVEVFYVPYNAASPATGVGLEGRSAADWIIGTKITCDVAGYEDDANGTYTGTPNARIEVPIDVISHFIQNFGAPKGCCDLTSFAAVRASQLAAISGGYFFEMVISKPVSFKTMIARLAFQCRTRIWMEGATFKAKFRDLTAGASQLSVTKAMMKFRSVSVSVTPKDEIINDMKISFQPDWKKGSPYWKQEPGSQSWIQVCMGNCDASTAYPLNGDPTSVSVIGIKRKTEWELMEFVPTMAMAKDLRDFYIGFYIKRHFRIAWTGFSQVVAVERFDDLALTHDAPAFNFNALMAETENLKYYPGSGKSKRIHSVEFTSRTY